MAYQIALARRKASNAFSHWCERSRTWPSSLSRLAPSTVWSWAAIACCCRGMKSR